MNLLQAIEFIPYEPQLVSVVSLLNMFTQLFDVKLYLQAKSLAAAQTKLLTIMALYCEQLMFPYNINYVYLWYSNTGTQI